MAHSIAHVPRGEDLASQDSWAQAGNAERQESTDRVHGAQEFRWKELAAFERKWHSSLERASEVAARTAEEWQPQRDLLKEAVPLAVPKVFRRQRPAHRGLEKLLQEFSCQGHTLSQVCREKAVLAQENAALEARLAATERDLRGLSEQLAEARCLSDRETKRYKQKEKDTEQLLFIFTPCRSEKESLQSSLLEAQQHIWELEMARSRVEAQVCRARQAKEAILEDVRGLRRELLAVRALSQQQCEDMAEQLRWAQEQCCKALRLWHSAQEEEKTNLMQELERQLEEQHVEAWKQLEERANFLAETSLLCSTGGEMKKRQLGKSLIPRLRKAGIPPVGSAAGSVHSSPQMELQESQEMRPRPSSRSQEKTPEHADLTGYPLAKRFSLASPSMLLPSKPLPPIQRSSPSAMPSKICSGEQETGNAGNGWDEESRKNQELTAEGRETSLLCSTGGEMKKRQLGKSLIPRLRKAGIPPVGSAAGSVHSSPQMELQESQEMRPRPSSRSQEKTPEHADLTGYPLAKRFSLASPSMLLPSKPLPPIQRSSPSAMPSKICSGEQETGNAGNGWDEESRKNQELTAEGRETSLLCSTGGEMKKRQLGKSLIPRLRKAGIPPVGSAAGSVHSSPQMELQESQEMRARPSSRSQEKTPEHASLSLSQAKETDHPSSPGLRSDKERRDSFGKTHAELCRLAKENLELKKMEILMEEMKRRQNEKSLLLPPETFEPGDAAEASKWWLHL
ncbi:uncharacterized protein LOC135291774 [Passer domesticus]|uniref:uncharacterized protein LOC135291774 n=1 Tax=Passer domesticus TaxID=48849 RepID=UPI0030FE4C24